MNTKEVLKLALEALEMSHELADTGYTNFKKYALVTDKDIVAKLSTAITALREALAKPDFWEGYVPEPEQPAQQCKWPTCQSEEYQQALAEQIKRELVSEQPAHQEPVWDASAPLVMTPHPAFQQPAQPYKGIADHINQATNGGMRIDPVTGDVGIGTPSKQPAQRTWVGLTEEEVMEIAFNFDVPSLVVRTVEAKLRSKNEDRN